MIKKAKREKKGDNSGRKKKKGLEEIREIESKVQEVKVSPVEVAKTWKEKEIDTGEESGEVSEGEVEEVGSSDEFVDAALDYEDVGEQWQLRNLEESLADVPFGTQGQEETRGGDFYKEAGSIGNAYGPNSNSQSIDYESVSGEGSNLYDEGKLYSAGEEDSMYQVLGEESKEEAGELRHANASQLEIQGLRSSGRNRGERERREDKKYETTA